MVKIAAISGAESVDTKAFLASAVARWRSSGARVAGLLAESHGIADRTCGAGFLRDIGTGKAYPIYLETAPSHTSCHLDATGVDAACAAVLRQIETCDLIVLSKFGKLEAAGGGLLPAFEAAIAAGKPVLTTVSDRQGDGWRAFAPDAVDLPADEAGLEQWRRSANAA